MISSNCVWIGLHAAPFVSLNLHTNGWMESEGVSELGWDITE